MCGCYNCILVVQWGYPLHFGVLWGALIPCHLCWVCVGVAVLVGLPLEVAQGPLLYYRPLEIAWGSSDLAALYLEVVDTVECRTGWKFQQDALGMMSNSGLSL